jgi:HEAT repeat protein
MVRLGHAYFLDRVVNALIHPSLARQAQGYLVELGSQGVSSLLIYLKDPDDRIRAAVTEVLGRVGDPAAQQDLQVLASDPRPNVVAAATLALRRLGQPVATR